MVHAADGVNLIVGEREWLGLVGETGCGKSVTALSILRLIYPPGRVVRGQIVFRGVDLLKLNEEEMRRTRGARVSMIFQDATESLNPVLKIGTQLVETITEHRQVSESEAREQAIELLEKVGIPDAQRRLTEYPHQLSGGMRQRVMIAIALSCHADLLIADEPTSNLDVTTQVQILNLMKELQHEFGMSVLLITHDLGVVATTCDRVAVMYAGRVVEVAETVRIFAEPRHPYTSALMGAIPKIHLKEEYLREIQGSVRPTIGDTIGCPFADRCSHVMDICRRVDPGDMTVGPRHMAACHLYG